MADKVAEDRGAEDTKVVPDEFGDAFDVAQGTGESADLSAADDPKNMKEESEEKPPETPPVVETPPVTPPAEQQPGETDEKYEQRYKTLQGIHKHDKDTWDAERAKLTADLEEAKKTKTPDKPVVEPVKEESAAEFIDSLTAEQKEQLAAYETDFDVVSKMEGIKRGAELAKLRKEMQADIQKWKDEISGKITAQDTRIAPIAKMAEETERQTHFNTIRDGYDLEDGTHVPGHNDFEKFRDDGSLLAWIEAKPRYLQPALKQTYSQGAAADVVDLIADFKRDSNIPLNQASDNVVPIDSKKAARKAALATVTTRRGAVNTGKAIADDFEGAFDEALNK